jgi:lysophospholipase L1-like esterase
VLQSELGPGYWIIDEGLNGRTTTRDDDAEPYRNGLAFLLPTLETHHPLDLVVVMLGTNDLKQRFDASPAEIAAGAGALVDAIRKSPFGPNGGAPAVLLISPPRIGCLQQFAADFESGFEKSQLLEPEFRRVAEARGCAFLDARVTGSDTDGVHLDREAHASLGTAVATAVKDVLPALRPPWAGALDGGG